MGERSSLALLSALVFLASAAFQPTATPEVRIVTDPPGAEVWSGSLRLGVTTKDGLKLSGLETGQVTFVIKKEGYGSAERTIEITPSTEPITLIVRLQAGAATTPAEASRTPGCGVSAGFAPEPVCSSRNRRTGDSMSSSAEGRVVRESGGCDAVRRPGTAG